MPSAGHLGSQTITLRAPHLNLANTLDCGQIFCWQKISPHRWRGWIDDSPVTIRRDTECETKLTITYKPGQLTPHRIVEFFGLDEDPADTLRTFPPDDPFLPRALRTAGGITILRQPLWECLASFICSSQKQVAHIQHINARLRALFGRDGRFPTAETLAALNPQQLRLAGLGYRARHLQATACRLAAHPGWLQNLRTLPTPALIEQLATLPGVGLKVAHCVALFAYHRLEAFPVDVWVHRIVTGLYFPRLRKKPTLREIYAFGPAYFGPCCGIAQQILFHWLRTMPPAQRKHIFSSARHIKVPTANDALRRLRKPESKTARRIKKITTPLKTPASTVPIQICDTKQKPPLGERSNNLCP